MEREKEILLVFGQNIKKAREKQNLDIRELASRAKYDRNCLSQLEYGEHNITYKTAVKLAKELNTSFPALFSRNYLTMIFLQSKKYWIFHVFPIFQITNLS